MGREITIMTPEQVELKFELAGLGSRFIAMMVDTMLQSLITACVLITAIYITGLSFDFFEYLSSWIIAAVFLFIFAFMGGYFLFFEVLKNGQTPGKKSVGIRVVLDTGHPVDFRASLLRNLMRMVDILPGTYGVGFVSIFLSPQYRRLGDYTAGTLVVKTRQKPQAVTTLTMPDDFDIESLTRTPDTTVPEGFLLPQEALPHLSSISRDDYRAVRHFLDRRTELEVGVSSALAAKLAGPLAAKLNIAPEMMGDPAAFLENLSREWERRMIH